MMPDGSAESLLACSARLGCLGILFQSLELLWLWPELREKHLLGWQKQGIAQNRLRRWLQRTQGFPVNLLIVAWRALAALACLFLPYGEPLMAGLLVSLFAAQVYYNRRFQLIFANADHMSLVCLAAVSVGGLPEASAPLRFAALAFLAFQVLLGYVSSGYDKVCAPGWRTGARLINVFQDSAHRYAALGDGLARHPGLAAALSWAVILLELLFPLCLLLPEAGFFTVLAAGVLFHASVAFTMGLPAFFWAFASTYPALYFIHSQWAEMAHS